MKRIKCEVKLSTKINKETNVVVIDEDDDGDDEEDDDIICMGDAISEQTTAVSPNNKASVESLDPKSVRRIELTTLSSKIDNETKTDVIQIDDTNKVNEESIKMSLVSFQEPVSSSGIPAEEESSSSKEEREFVPEFNDFIATCLQCECSKKYKDMIKKKIPTLMAKYMELDEEYVTSKKFKNLLKYSSDNMQRKPSNAIIHFNDVYQELRCNNIGELKLTETQFRHLDMLNRAMSKVHKRILRLESRDAQLHDENNSVYIMVARYHERLCTIYKKICNITGENIHSSRYLYKNLDMNSSRYQEINKAVDRLYYKTKTFPSYYDMDKCVRQCVEKNQLKINGAELELEGKLSIIFRCKNTSEIVGLFPT